MCFVGLQNLKANLDALVTVSNSTAMYARRNGSVTHFAVKCPSGSLLAFCAIALYGVFTALHRQWKKSGPHMYRDCYLVMRDPSVFSLIWWIAFLYWFLEYPTQGARTGCRCALWIAVIASLFVGWHKCPPSRARPHQNKKASAHHCEFMPCNKTTRTESIAICSCVQSLRTVAISTSSKSSVAGCSQ